eukprot:CAMPEP_0115755642 /NCGR_PEP_ID=MMETSP0272-20121206/97501_1 /TAXON_ID=71861 /ORGANISM="Scrippsiella trochoidea, Strain CCMP3099" /LENGTH=54 /DNA_ID=CAMNT_0003201107 /DNA_START=101 /DNA_END=265 /DNA_ORIENTATION=-
MRRPQNKTMHHRARRAQVEGGWSFSMHTAAMMPAIQEEAAYEAKTATGRSKIVW